LNKKNYFGDEAPNNSEICGANIENMIDSIALVNAASPSPPVSAACAGGIVVALLLTFSKTTPY
jgi:hypothetical protein